MSLRILFVIHVPADPYGAVFNNSRHRAERLRREGHVVDLMTRTDLPFQRLQRLDPLLLSMAVARRVRGYDIVAFHSHLGWAFHAARRWLDRRRQTTTVTVFHGLEPLYHRAEDEELARSGGRRSIAGRLLHNVVVSRLLRMSCRRSDVVFCLNHAEQDYLVSNEWADASKVKIVANGVEPEFLLRRTHRSTASVLLFVAQWLRPKGTRYLVDAFARTAARHPDLRLVCAGTRASEERVLADFPAALRSRVEVKPHVTRTQLIDDLARADVFVFPTLSEGFSGALLEGMAAGLPIVATAAGAAADLLGDGRNALVVPCASADALAASIERLLGDPDLRQRLGETAARDAERFRWDRVNDDYSRYMLQAAGLGVRAGENAPAGS